MSIKAIITDGFGTFGTVPDVIRMGYGASAEVPVVSAPARLIVGGGADLREFVVAEMYRRNQLKAISLQEKELVKIKRKIKTVEKKAKQKPKQEPHEGILNALIVLEDKKERIEQRIYQLKIDMIPLERFLEAEIDEDDEEIMELMQ